MSELRRIYVNGREASDKDRASLAHSAFRHVQERAVSYEDLEKIKKEVQWDVFWNIVNEIARKSGIEPNDINRVHQNMIVGQGGSRTGTNENEMGGGRVLGYYTPELNAIGVDYDGVRNLADVYNLNDELITTFILFHEMAHSIMSERIYSKNVGNNTGQSIEERVELGPYHFSKRIIASDNGKVVSEKVEEKNVLFNEAITETLAFSIFNEYARRTGKFSKEDMDKYENGFFKDRDRNYYTLVKSLRIMCDQLGKNANVDGETVIQALIRGVFYNQVFEDSEIKKWFAEAFSPTFLTEVSEAKKAIDFFAVMHKYHVLFEAKNEK